MALIGLTLCAPIVEQLLTSTRTWTNQQKANGRSLKSQIWRPVLYPKSPRAKDRNRSLSLPQKSRNPKF